MRVLIVEDERRLAQTLADLMEAHNYGADIAYDGEEGLDNALSGIYDVILLDVMLPKRSGMRSYTPCGRKGIRLRCSC